MEILQVIESYINGCEMGEPIFTQDIVSFVKLKFSKADDKTIITYINRTVKRIANLKTYKKGIYYKAKETPFGFTPINENEVLVKRYLKSNGKVIGYETGPSFMQKLGLTTQIPKYKYLATTKVNNNRVDDTYNVYLLKANLLVVQQNYKYFQLLDVLCNNFEIEIECKNEYVVYRQYVKNNGLQFENLLRYALEYKKNDKILKKIALIAVEAI